MREFTKEYGATIISVILVVLVIMFTQKTLRNGSTTTYQTLSKEATLMSEGIGDADTTYTDYSQTVRTKPTLKLVEGTTFYKNVTYNIKDYIVDTNATPQTVLSVNILSSNEVSADIDDAIVTYDYQYTDEEDLTSYTRPEVNTTGSVSTFKPSKSGVWRLSLSVVTKDANEDNQRSNVVVYAVVE